MKKLLIPICWLFLTLSVAMLAGCMLGPKYSRPETTADGDQGIEFLDQEEIDLVITDINMPYTKGLELVRYVNTKLGTKIPVIIISGITLDETKDHALELGALGYLTKPFDPEVLLKMVKSVADKN